VRDDQIQRIKKRSTAIEKAFDDFLKFLGSTTDRDGRAFDISTQIPTTDSSVSDLRARAAAVAGLIRKFDDKGAALTPLSDFIALVNAGNAVSNALSQTTEAIAGHSASTDGFQAIEYESLSFTGNNGSVVSFQGHFKTLFDSMESYVQTFQNVFQATNPSRASFNFSSATEAFSAVLGQARRAQNSLQETLKTATEELEQIKKRQADFNAILDDVRAKQNILTDQTGQASEFVTNITARNEEANSLNATTAKLRDRVNTYQAEFDAFQAQIEGMKDNYTTGDKQLKLLIEQFNKQSETFDAMILKSNQMLSSSTVAGLASEFGTIRTEMGASLSGAHTSFKWSIGFLFVSAVPLILFVFAPFLIAAFPDNQNLVNAISGMTASQSGWHYVGQVFARFVILLPAIWYVAFCTARYNSLFKLKEHYSYKYSMAVAVEGFKKQAPQYEDMIAALVFEQIAFNPADKLGKHHDGPEQPPNPIAQMLVKLLRRDAAADE
jgi:predicted  nucleic acid-binding Zn-ribbon protein